MEPLKLFISYSHSDEVYLKDLKDHLSVLESNELINVWCDKELVVGDELEKEIKNNLVSSDLIVFLISPDFLKSYYCYRIELMSTLERLPNHNIRVIPVIIRDCLWKETALKKFVAAPKDGKHLSTFSDRDEYWTEVVTSIKIAAEKLGSVKKEVIEKTLKSLKNVSLDSNFESYLNNTQIKLNHKHKESVTLDDIYVFGDLKNVKGDYEELEDILYSKDLSNFAVIEKGVLILGGEQIGKTSYLKKLFKSYFEQKAFPLLIDGNDINSSNIGKNLNKWINQQYKGLTKEEYFEGVNTKILLIDDYHKIKLNPRHHVTFLNNVKLIFDKIIVLADSSFKYDEHKYIEFSDFGLYEMLLFGSLRRSQMVNRWNSLGRVETISDVERHSLNDRAMMHIESIIGKGIVPRKPFYILTILQFLDASSGTDLTLTSYGHCYQRLIQNQLSKVDIGYRDFDIYFNYLEALAFEIYKNNNGCLKIDDFENFKKSYSKKHVIQSHDEVINKLVNSGILVIRDYQLYFGYRYFYYFYAAKYISDNISHCQECKNIVENLCENLYSEKNANILIFLVHHSRDKHIIDEILLSAYSVFDGTEDATLDYNETKHLMDYIASIPNMVLEQKDVERERTKRLKAKDKIDDIGVEEKTITEEELEDAHSTLTDINKSLRVIDLIGQIIRNRYGSLTRDQLLDLTRSAYSSGLKLLNVFLKLTRTDSSQILSFIEGVFEKNTEFDDEEIAKQARKIFLILCYGASYSIIKKIAHSIGTDRLIEIFDQIAAEHHDSPAKQLINIAIKLEFTKQIPKDDIKKLLSTIENNPISNRLLQEVVVQHLYMNIVEYKDRQWIASTLDLPVSSQRLIQRDAAQKE